MVQALGDALAGTDKALLAIRMNPTGDELDANSELREREAPKYAGYLAAIASALVDRSVPQATATVAADLGMLAFRTAFVSWAQSDSPPPLPELVHATLEELHDASTSLR